MEKNWKLANLGGTPEQQKLAEATVEFFIDLGNKLIAGRLNGAESLLENPFPSHTKITTFRDIGFASDLLRCNFNYGDESDVAQKLFGINSMTYQRFFERVYEGICELIGGRYQFEPHAFTVDLKRLGVIK